MLNPPVEDETRRGMFGGRIYVSASYAARAVAPLAFSLEWRPWVLYTMIQEASALGVRFAACPHDLLVDEEDWVEHSEEVIRRVKQRVDSRYRVRFKRLIQHDEKGGRVWLEGPHWDFPTHIAIPRLLFATLTGWSQEYIQELIARGRIICAGAISWPWRIKGFDEDNNILVVPRTMLDDAVAEAPKTEIPKSGLKWVKHKADSVISRFFRNRTLKEPPPETTWLTLHEWATVLGVEREKLIKFLRYYKVPVVRALPDSYVVGVRTMLSLLESLGAQRHASKPQPRQHRPQKHTKALPRPTPESRR